MLRTEWMDIQGNMVNPMQDDLNIQMLVKLLGMTTSSHDGEALNAVRMANALLDKYDVNWDQVLRSKVPMIDADPFASLPGVSRIKGEKTVKYSDKTEIDAYFLVLRSRNLGTFQTYVDSVYEWWKEKNFLTQKQYDVIKKAAHKRVNP